MLYGFERRRTPKRYCLSIDLRKAFYTVKLEAIISTLKAYGFSPHLCKIIWNCISTTSFSIFVEGSSIPPFRNHRGYQTGRPPSQIQFYIIMDVLRRLIEREVEAKRIDTYKVNGATFI